MKHTNDAQIRIAALQKKIATREADLIRKINRRREIDTRYRLEIKAATDELNNLKAELYDLQEACLPKV